MALDVYVCMCVCVCVCVCVTEGQGGLGGWAGITSVIGEGQLPQLHYIDR